MASGKGFGFGRGKRARKGPPIVWSGSISPEDFPEAVYEFLVESRSDFTKDSPLRGYDNRIEDWPKCMHGEDCLVQMCAEGMDGGRRFFKCPRAWVILSIKSVLDMFNMYCMIYIICCVSGIQCSRELRVRTMGRSSPIHPHAEYIYYLHNRIFDLEIEVSSGNNEEEEDENKGPSPPKYPCTIPYCNCPCHNNNPLAPPPPPAMGAYYGDGSTQFANWEQY